jgi:hypothetical protein
MICASTCGAISIARRSAAISPVSRTLTLSSVCSRRPKCAGEADWRSVAILLSVSGKARAAPSTTTEIAVVANSALAKK